MIPSDDKKVVNLQGELHTMKKLMTLMLGFALATTVVVPTFAAATKATKAKTTKAPKKSTKA